jgi:zinc protease
MKTRTVFSFGGVIVLAAHSAFAIGGTDKPPAPSVPHATTFAHPREAKLDNGLQVLVAERRDLPLITIQLVVRSGSEADPENLAGTASMTASLLTKGTEKRSAPEIANAIESLGGTIFSGGGWDSASAGVVVMSDKAEPALDVLSDVVLHPKFDQQEIDRLKSQRLDGLRVSLQQPGSLSGYVMARVVFGTAPYGHASTGTLETVQAMKRDDIVKLYQTCYTPDNATLILAGDVTLEQGTAFAQRFFGEWKADHPAPQRPTNDQGNADWKSTNIVIDMPQAGQAAVNLAKPAIKRASPDYYTGLVANAALGTGFNSRLNQEIRIKRGLSYGARSGLEPRRDVGPFVASTQTKNESAAEVAGLMQSELKRLGTSPIQGDELKSRQAVLTGSYARNLETNQGFAGQLSTLAVHGLPLDTLDKFIPAINAVTADDVSAFAAKYFSTPPSLIVVGKAPAFIDALKKDFPDVKVIAQGDLDLNRGDLTKAK